MLSCKTISWNVFPCALSTIKGRHTEPHEKTDQKRLTLTIRMMLGVRVAVGRQSNPLERQEVVDEDFHQVRCDGVGIGNLLRP